MADISRESIGTLHDQIKIKLNKDDYMPLFDKDLKTYSKSANIPGFRKGKVPAGVIKKMFGKGLFADAVVKTAEDNLKNYLSEEKLDIFGQPLFLNDEERMPQLDLQKPDDYEFLFEIGLQPELEQSIPEGIKGLRYKVEVKPEDIDQRIDGFQSQFGELKDAEKVEGPETIAYILIEEIGEDGKKINEGLSEDTSLYVKVFKEDAQKKLEGKKKDDHIEGQLGELVDPEGYPGVYQNLNLDPKNEEETGKKVKVTITSLKTMDKAPLNEELFKKAYPDKEIKTEEEFRKAVEEDEQSYWDQAADNYMEHDLFHQFIESPITLPDDFLKKLMKEQINVELTPEESEKEYKGFSEQLKWSLISNKIVKDQKLQVNPEEIQEDVKQELRQYFGPSMNLGAENEWLDNYVNELLRDRKQLEQRVDKLMSRKIFDWVKSQVPIEEKEISQEDFKELVNKHSHHH